MYMYILVLLSFILSAGKSERVIGYRTKPQRSAIGDRRDDNDVVMPAPVADIRTYVQADKRAG